MPGSVDSTDLKILSVLLRNARTPYSQIARMLNLGESTVYMRVRKLIDMGVLRAFTIDVDLSKLGFVVQAFVDIKAEPKKMGDILMQLKSMPCAVEVYEVSSEYPITARIVARDNIDLSEKIDMVARINGVKDVRVRYVLKVISNQVSTEFLAKLLRTQL